MELVKGYILLLAWNSFTGVVLEGFARCWFVTQDLHPFFFIGLSSFLRCFVLTSRNDFNLHAIMVIITLISDRVFHFVYQSVRET